MAVTDEALQHGPACHRARRLAEAANNHGVSLALKGQLDEAAVSFDNALSLRPGFAEAHNNLALVRKEQGRLDEAVTSYRRAVGLKPDFAEARYNLSLALLKQGDMAAGWDEYEWRWNTPHLAKDRRAFPQPQWRGEAAAGQTLLVHAEQGFGDSLQFCRYAPLAAARGLRVVVEAPKPLVRLFRSLAGVDAVAERGEDLPAFDLRCPMMSLPLAFATTLETIPNACPYLQADGAKAAAWGARLAALPGHGMRIGLVWAGNPAPTADHRRSLSPHLLAPLCGLPGVQVFSLQKGGTDAAASLPLMDFMEEMDDFADTAALVANLDLVISVDTAVAHLALALGKPVWLLAQFDPCWRWLTGRRDSPWYPALRLYRQPCPGAWDLVLPELARDLRAALSGCVPL